MKYDYDTLGKFLSIVYIISDNKSDVVNIDQIINDYNAYVNNSIDPIVIIQRCNKIWGMVSSNFEWCHIKRVLTN